MPWIPCSSGFHFSGLWSSSHCRTKSSKRFLQRQKVLPSSRRMRCRCRKRPELDTTKMRILPLEPKVPRPVPWHAWGRYPPHMRYNCDQVPFNLDNSGRKTYIKAQSDVAVISGQPGSEKRFGTLQVCLHAGKSSQPPLTIIFRGGGPKRFEREFPRYHPGVRVLWQPKAWMDSQLAVAWASQVCPLFRGQTPW